MLAEIDRIQNRKPTWTRALTYLVVSLFLFVGAGVAEWDWRFVLMLIPILLLHELGHLVAMLTFGYRNVKMFFIPFFGAAVSGQNHSAAGWKKAIVSLAGPLPGIGCAIVLGFVAITLQRSGVPGLSDVISSLFEFALLMLILNGFNLLPVLPLDGGHLAHTLLFCRHPLPDVLFRVAASIGLIVFGLMASAWIMMGLGFLMLLGLPLAWNTAKLAHELRAEHLPHSDDDTTVPRETAERIIDGLCRFLPDNTGMPVYAGQTLHVFERVNARPPGVLATIVLGGVHAFSFLGAVVAAVVLATFRNG